MEIPEFQNFRKIFYKSNYYYFLIQVIWKHIGRNKYYFGFYDDILTNKYITSYDTYGLSFSISVITDVLQYIVILL